MEEGEMGGACGTHAHRILFGKSEGKSLLGRPKHRCKDNIKICFREIGWVRVDCIHLVQDRDKSVANPDTQCGIVPGSAKPDLWIRICHWDKWQILLNTVVNLHVPWNVEKFLTIYGIITFSKMTKLFELMVTQK
jgi:hypothetical protein